MQSRSGPGCHMSCDSSCNCKKCLDHWELKAKKKGTGLWQRADLSAPRITRKGQAAFCPYRTERVSRSGAFFFCLRFPVVPSIHSGTFNSQWYLQFTVVPSIPSGTYVQFTVVPSIHSGTFHSQWYLQSHCELKVPLGIEGTTVN